MIKCTNLHSRTAEIRRPHSPEVGVKNITSHHDVPTVGQPTENMSDTYSLVDTTEEQVVDESLLTSQRIIDSRLASINP